MVWPAPNIQTPPTIEPSSAPSLRALTDSIDPRTLMAIADMVELSNIHKASDIAERLRNMARNQYSALATEPHKIADARHAAGLTQTQAGALIHAPLRTWQDWEYGKRNMPEAKWELFKLKLQVLKTA